VVWCDFCADFFFNGRRFRFAVRDDIFNHLISDTKLLNLIFRVFSPHAFFMRERAFPVLTATEYQYFRFRFVLPKSLKFDSASPKPQNHERESSGAASARIRFLYMAAKLRVALKPESPAGNRAPDANSLVQPDDKKPCFKETKTRNQRLADQADASVPP